MNNDSNLNGDLLRQYISPEKIENAPEGFTSRVMFRIGSEKTPEKVKEHFFKIHLVPIVSITMILLLIIAAFLIPESQSGTTLAILNFFKNIKLSLPEADLSDLFRLNLPSVSIYIIIGIACLTVFDKALSGIFKSK